MVIFNSYVKLPEGRLVNLVHLCENLCSSSTKKKPGLELFWLLNGSIHSSIPQRYEGFPNMSPVNVRLEHYPTTGDI